MSACAEGYNGKGTCQTSIGTRPAQPAEASRQRAAHKEPPYGVEIITRSLLNRPNTMKGPALVLQGQSPEGPFREAARASRVETFTHGHRGLFDESVISQVGNCGSSREHKDGRLLYRCDSMA